MATGKKKPSLKAKMIKRAKNPITKSKPKPLSPGAKAAGKKKLATLRKKRSPAAKYSFKTASTIKKRGTTVKPKITASSTKPTKKKKGVGIKAKGLTAVEKARAGATVKRRTRRSAKIAGKMAGASARKKARLSTRLARRKGKTATIATKGRAGARARIKGEALGKAARAAAATRQATSDKSPAKKYVGFKKLSGSLSKKYGKKAAGAIAASIGRKKYGAKKFNTAAGKGKKLKGAKKK